MTKAIDLTGQRFGKLTVQALTDKRQGNSIVWSCICDCGNYKEAASTKLRRGDTKSCGCLLIKDLSGQQFHNLFAVSYCSQRLGGSVIWRCLCICGSEAFISADSLQSGKTRSCGCLQREVQRLRQTTHGQSRTRGYNAARSRARELAKIQRTPSWANLDDIRQFYINCPDGYHVDHIIPLRGEYVSGLHVLDNLQYLPATENLRKRNKFYPTIFTRSTGLSQQIEH